MKMVYPRSTVCDPVVVASAQSCFMHSTCYLDGYDMKACPLVKRKALLKRILPKTNTGRVRYTDHISCSGQQLFRFLDALNLEGMGMKRKDSVYASIRSRDWLKVKTAAGRLTMQKRIETWGE
jgi:ATP-dependent DNA ligase